MHLKKVSSNLQQYSILHEFERLFQRPLREQILDRLVRGCLGKSFWRRSSTKVKTSVLQLQQSEAQLKFHKCRLDSSRGPSGTAKRKTHREEPVSLALCHRTCHHALHWQLEFARRSFDQQLGLGDPNKDSFYNYY
jgi:hypothetical protein